MIPSISDSARRVLSLAEVEARDLNHAYVGTEHVLLALLQEGSRDTAGVLSRLGLSIESVRAEIAKFVIRGPAPVPPGALPLTPRSRHVVLMARESAGILNLPSAGPELLLIALMREPDGVAHQVLVGLGLTLRQLAEESLKTRKQQMRIVERVVRPIRAGMKYKRKMREEMLAHLTHIYNEELSNSDDPAAALTSAARRFGDPVELARELQASIPGSERRNYFFERWLGWRPPESVSRMLARSSLASFAIIGLVVGVAILAGILYQGWDASQGQAIRTLVAMLIVIPLAQFGFGWSYYKLRDARFGVFGATRSTIPMLRWSLLAGAVLFAAGMGFAAMVRGVLVPPADVCTIMAIVGAAGAILCPTFVHLRGPTEIRDTIWATLELEA